MPNITKIHTSFYTISSSISCLDEFSSRSIFTVRLS
uniref:Uncharacterized protein n=1 Tax=Siphoviridae sp. ctNHg2 TaxID=2825467 RepID=A0A8S5V4J4_9CAUD|nr:MAG TPA: hypothetical protein [Siphoviridae sp. ctNHg2]